MTSRKRQSVLRTRAITASGAMALIVLAGPALAQSIDLSPVQTLAACAQHNPAQANCFNFRDAPAQHATPIVCPGSAAQVFRSCNGAVSCRR